MPWDDDLQIATFSAGKFWGVQFYFDQVPGVIKSRVGYTGGNVENPTAELVAAQNTGHTEAVELEFDSSLINFDTLLKHFFRIHDPTKVNSDDNEKGDQFRSVIYYHSEDQRILAEITMSNLKQNYKKPLLTELLPVGIFYEAASSDQKFTQITGKGMNHIPYEEI